MSSLATCLNTGLNGQYTSLFTNQKGYLIYDEQKKNWSIKRTKISDEKAYFDALTRRLSAVELRELIAPDAFIQRLNEAWTLSQGINNRVSGNGPVLFNSKIKEHEFLSNFFPTVITLGQGGEVQVFLSSEAAYVDAKVRALGSAITSGGAESGEKAKKFGKKVEKAHVLLEGEESAWNEAEKLTVMKEIVKRKFELNPLLKQKLKNTQDRPLYEATSDQFWGIGVALNNHSPELQNPGQVVPSGNNHLGQILTEIRQTA